MRQCRRGSTAHAGENNPLHGLCCICFRGGMKIVWLSDFTWKNRPTLNRRSSTTSNDTDFKIFGAFNALRRPSEANTPWLVRIFCITRSSGGFPHYGAFSRRFPSEHGKHRTSSRQSSEVLPQKYGCLPPRIPVFFDPKNDIFHAFSPLFGSIFAESGKEVRLRSL